MPVWGRDNVLVGGCDNVPVCEREEDEADPGIESLESSSIAASKSQSTT